MSWKPQLLLLDEPTASLGVTEIRAGGGADHRAAAAGHHDRDGLPRRRARCSGWPTASWCSATGGCRRRDVRTEAHPDDVAALISGQQVDSSARRQLTRLHGLADRLVSADPSSSLSLILSALGAALGSRTAVHPPARATRTAGLRRLARPARRRCWPPGRGCRCGPAGGPVGLAAATAEAGHRGQRAGQRRLGAVPRAGQGGQGRSSWSVPVLGPGGLIGVITVFRPRCRPPAAGRA